MLDAALAPRPIKTLLALVSAAALACVTVWTLTQMRRYGDDSQFFHSRDNPFSMWQPLHKLGCAPPNEHGTFIAASLLPDEHGDPYIWECGPDTLRINDVTWRVR